MPVHCVVVSAPTHAAALRPPPAQDILEKLDVPLSLRFRSSVHRANLFFEIRPKPTGAGGGGQLEDALVALVREFKADESGIVYCFSRKECETFAVRTQSAST